MHALPRNSPAVLLCSQAFDVAAGATSQGHHPAALAMDLMDAAEPFAVERRHLGVAQLAQAHHSAPLVGIHAVTLSSTRSSRSSSARQPSFTTLPISTIF